jgi:hypothetical protein
MLLYIQQRFDQLLFLPPYKKLCRMFYLF